MINSPTSFVRASSGNEGAHFTTAESKSGGTSFIEFRNDVRHVACFNNLVGAHK